MTMERNQRPMPKFLESLSVAEMIILYMIAPNKDSGALALSLSSGSYSTLRGQYSMALYDFLSYQASFCSVVDVLQTEEGKRET